MRRLMCWAAAFTLLHAAPAAADVQLTIANGRVTLVATNATVREILAEWARVGQTRVVNGERVAGAPVTLELRDVPESQALAIVLRAVSGYIAAPRAVPDASVSKFDRILVMPASAPPRAAATGPAPPVFAPPPAPTVSQGAAPDDASRANTMNDLRNDLLNRAQQTFQDLNNANTAQPATPAAPVFLPPGGQPEQAPAAQPAQATTRPAGQTNTTTSGSRRPGVVTSAPSTPSTPDR
jgi:hypothetical protein